MHSVDILLVNPANSGKVYGSLREGLSAVEPPLWSALIAGYLRKRGFSVSVVDAEAEGWDDIRTAEEIILCRPLLACLSAVGANPSASSTPKMPSISSILRILKERSPDIKTALFGIHPSAVPKVTLENERIDFLCRGEAFYTLEKLLSILVSGRNKKDIDIRGLWYKSDGRIVENGWGELVRDLDELPFAAWDLLPMPKYRAHNWHCFGRLDKRQPYGVIYTSLGCPFNCSYCNVNALYDGNPGIRYRSLIGVADEIGALRDEYGIQNLKILDELFVMKEERVLEFCDLMIKRGYDLNMWAYARIDTVNERVLERMKEAGINWLSYGIESGSRKVRENVTKRGFGRAAIERAISITHAAGISVIGNFMFGLPEDDMETMGRTLETAKSLDLEYANFYSTMAYPGSKLYDEEIKKGTRLSTNWLAYSQLGEDTEPMGTKKLSPKQIVGFRDKAFRDFFEDPAYLAGIKKKFGENEVGHIRKMLEHDIKRAPLGCSS
ncbi:MAG: B12-binding domain-containing radical SAM protein [Candidatus Omnitrophica bacterium]|nr:B12-binding domain-containing radical SAM protein [Candidatus Omnitrophota bacterium]